MDKITAETQYRFAQQLCSEGNYSEALPILRYLDKEFSGSCNIMMAYAHCAAQLGLQPEAKEVFSKISLKFSDPDITQLGEFINGSKTTFLTIHDKQESGSKHNAIFLSCPSCNGKLNIASKYAGQVGKCKYCGAHISVPQVIIQTQNHRPTEQPLTKSQKITEGRDYTDEKQLSNQMKMPQYRLEGALSELRKISDMLNIIQLCKEKWGRTKLFIGFGGGCLIPIVLFFLLFVIFESFIFTADEVKQGKGADIMMIGSFIPGIILVLLLGRTKSRQKNELLEGLQASLNTQANKFACDYPDIMRNVFALDSTRLVHSVPINAAIQLIEKEMSPFAVVGTKQTLSTLSTLYERDSGRENKQSSQYDVLLGRTLTNGCIDRKCGLIITLNEIKVYFGPITIGGFITTTIVGPFAFLLFTSLIPPTGVLTFIIISFYFITGVVLLIRSSSLKQKMETLRNGNWDMICKMKPSIIIRRVDIKKVKGFSINNFTLTPDQSDFDKCRQLFELLEYELKTLRVPYSFPVNSLVLL